MKQESAGRNTANLECAIRAKRNRWRGIEFRTHRRSTPRQRGRSDERDAQLREVGRWLQRAFGKRDATRQRRARFEAERHTVDVVSRNRERRLAPERRPAAASGRRDAHRCGASSQRVVAGADGREAEPAIRQRDRRSREGRVERVPRGGVCTNCTCAPDAPLPSGRVTMPPIDAVGTRCNWRSTLSTTCPGTTVIGVAWLMFAVPGT